MAGLQQQSEELVELRLRLATVDQENEQLQIALEDVTRRLDAIAEESSALQAERRELIADNAHLRHLLAQSQARFLEAQVSAGRDSQRPRTGLEGEISILNEELQVSLEELQVTAEELENANAALRVANETLERQVAERTANLDLAVAERDALIGRKDLLIREVDHRVKNSLQMVMSLLRIQARSAADAATRQALQTAVMRIQAIAQVHSMLHARNSAEGVAFHEYLDEICTFLGETLGVDGRRRRLEVEADAIEVPTDLAIPLALVTAELVTNAFRHAFGGETGSVRVCFRRSAGGGVELMVADDGCGLPADFDWSHGKGLGLQVVKAMAEQVGGRVDVARQDGTRFILKLPLP